MVLRRISIVLQGNCIREAITIALAYELLIPSGWGGRADTTECSEDDTVGREATVFSEREATSAGDGETTCRHREATFVVGGETFSTGKEDSLEFRGSMFPVSSGSSHMVPSVLVPVYRIPFFPNRCFHFNNRNFLGSSVKHYN